MEGEHHNENVLIIFGCSLSKADNHVNAIIRDYLIQGGKIIYCNYLEDTELKNDNAEEVLTELRKKLKINVDEGGEIEVVSHSKDISVLFQNKAFAEYISKKK